MPTENDLSEQVDAVFAEFGITTDPNEQDSDTTNPISAIFVFCDAGRTHLDDDDASEQIIDEYLDGADTDTDAVHRCLDLCGAGAMAVSRWMRRILDAHNTQSGDEASGVALFDLSATSYELPRTAMQVCNAMIRQEPDEVADVLRTAAETHGPLWMRHMVSVLLDLYVTMRHAYREVARDR